MKSIQTFPSSLLGHRTASSSAFSHSVPQYRLQLGLMSCCHNPPHCFSTVFIVMCVKCDIWFYSVEGTARLCLLQTWEPWAGNAWNSQIPKFRWQWHGKNTDFWGVQALEHRFKDLSFRSPSQVRHTNTLKEVALSSTNSHGKVRLLVCNMPANSKERREHAADHRPVYVSTARR